MFGDLISLKVWPGPLVIKTRLEGVGVGIFLVSERMVFLLMKNLGLIFIAIVRFEVLIEN